MKCWGESDASGPFFPLLLLKQNWLMISYLFLKICFKSYFFVVLLDVIQVLTVFLLMAAECRPIFKTCIVKKSDLLFDLDNIFGYCIASKFHVLTC